MDPRTTTEIKQAIREKETLLALYQGCGNPDARNDIQRLSQDLEILRALLPA